MKKIIPFIILSIILHVKCDSTSKSGNADHTTADPVRDRFISKSLNFPKSGEDTLKASYFADTVIYVPLETTADNFIQHFKQLWMKDSLILINNHSSLLLFHRNGKFIRQIGRHGKGPGEYGNIFRFDVIRDTIYISSTSRRSLLEYTFDGIFCDEIQLDYQPVYFGNTADQRLACYVQYKGNILVYNNDFSTPDTIIVEYGVTTGRYKYTVADPSFMTYIQKTPSGLLFNNYMSDTIWNITSEKKEPAFILNMKDKLLPRDQHIEFCNGDFKRWERTAKSCQQVHLLVYPSYMFIFQKYWLTPNYSAIYISNTKTGEIKKFNSPYIYDDIVSKQKLSFVIFSNSEDYLVAGIEPYDLLKDLRQNEKNVKETPSSKWLSQIKNISENDNLILVFMKIKKYINE